MNTPNVREKVADHFRAFIWAGRPVAIRYLYRDNYFRDPTRFGGGAGMITDGSSRVRHSVSTVCILLPLLADRSETLRHECGHIRFEFAPRPPAALAEARRLFRELEPEDAALYEGRDDDFDMSGEAVVRLADRVRSGLPMPPMSEPLSKLVRVVVAPAPASAVGFVLITVMLLAALVSAASTASAADLIAHERITSAAGVVWAEGTCVDEGGNAIVGRWIWPGGHDLTAQLDAVSIGYIEGTASCAEIASMCMSVDVRHGEVITAATSNARRMNDLEAACRVIHALWGQV